MYALETVITINIYAYDWRYWSGASGTFFPTSTGKKKLLGRWFGSFMILLAFFLAAPGVNILPYP